MRKKITTLICIIITISILTASAGTNGTEATPTPPAAPQPEQTETMTITWGQPSSITQQIPANAEVIQWFNEQFSVTIEPMRFLDSPHNAYQQILDIHAAAGTLPDIFFLLPGVMRAYEDGITRTIPRHMIETHAPNYARWISSEWFGWDVHRLNEESDEYIGLAFSGNIMEPVMHTFSMYRLDWLNNLGITPNGPVNEISERMYYTQDAFSIDQLRDIITAFVHDDRIGEDATIGMALSFANIHYLLGMFGLNFENVYENGRATWWFASERYKDMLMFLANLYNEGLVTIDFQVNPVNNPHVINGNAGWWAESVISPGASISESLLDADPEARILITPPEIGSNGEQGVTASGQVFNTVGAFVINRNVEDDKLAKILQIFNAAAFDPATFVIANFGFEGEDFDWAGEPFNSRVISRHPQSAIGEQRMARQGIGLFNTRIIDGNAGTLAHFAGNTLLLDIARSPANLALLNFPYREDILGQFAAEQDIINERYMQGINSILFEYLVEAVTGVVNIAATWDEYIENLRRNGLDEMHELIGRFPEVRR